jgi:hypothetical protein
MQRWQHCRLKGNRVQFLGAAGILENKADAHLSERTAWSKLEDDGWELVSAVSDPDGEFVYFFKRPATDEL